MCHKNGYIYHCRCNQVTRLCLSPSLSLDCVCHYFAPQSPGVCGALVDPNPLSVYGRLGTLHYCWFGLLQERS